VTLSREAAENLARRIATTNPDGARTIRGALVPASAAPRLTTTPAPPQAPPSPPRSRWRAVRTDCDAGHRHDSKTEARVCAAIRAEIAGTPALLFVRARLPVFALGPDEGGRASFVSIDFAVVDPATLRPVRLVDAKPRNRAARSRDWRRGALALRRSYGLEVEERSA
jgi:hypothetical protein